jgi:hypothetical protein
MTDLEDREQARSYKVGVSAIVDACLQAMVDPGVAKKSPAPVKVRGSLEELAQGL